MPQARDAFEEVKKAYQVHLECQRSVFICSQSRYVEKTKRDCWRVLQGVFWLPLIDIASVYYAYSRMLNRRGTVHVRLHFLNVARCYSASLMISRVNVVSIRVTQKAFAGRQSPNYDGGYDRCRVHSGDERATKENGQRHVAGRSDEGAWKRRGAQEKGLHERGKQV